MKKAYFALLCAILVVPCAAKTIIVDCNGGGDYTKIQDAINHSLDGDTVIVKPGTYNQSIHFYGRAITLTSDSNEPDAVESTIITASVGYSVNFDWAEGPNSVITGFTITRGIYGASSATPTISGNIIRSNSGWGIDGCNGLITNNTISENIGGIAYCDGLIINNIIRNNSASYGGGLYFCDGDIVDNVIANNSANQNGGAFYRCDGNISGNIIVGSKAGNDGGGLYGCGDNSDNVNNNIIAGNKSQHWGGGFYNCDAYIYNNTIVGNRANRGGAIDSCVWYTYNNIIAFNQADNIGGIYGSSFHSYNVFWENEGGHLGEPPGPGDVVFDPYFAVEGYWDPNGTPEQSDDFWVNGDYHVKSKAGRWDPNSKTWIIDGVTSPCVDSGDPDSDWTEELWPHGERINIGAYGGTTQASMSLSSKNNVANLTDEPEPNDWVGYDDLMLLTDKWLCKVNDVQLAEWLDKEGVYKVMLEYLIHVPMAEDLDRDGTVDLSDYAIFAANWCPPPPPRLPPEPNIMTWETEPYAISPYAIAMLATTATSTDGSGVEYYFKNITISGHDRGWQVEPNYTDTGLSPSTGYGYKVKARNKGNQVETEWSQERFATTFPPDTTPPQPDPTEWQEQPHAISPTSIRMVAKDANDPSGVEYYFECTSHPNDYSSNWQESPIYEVGVPKGLYKFVARARDKSPNHNTTGDSNEVTVDLKPPTPDPMQWAVGGEPNEVHLPPYVWNSYGAEMTAAEATDDNGVEYKFVCSDSDFSSGGAGDPGPEWRNSDNVDGDPRTYTVKIGQRSYVRSVTFYVIARDRSPNHNPTDPSWPPLPPTY